MVTALLNPGARTLSIVWDGKKATADKLGVLLADGFEVELLPFDHCLGVSAVFSNGSFRFMTLYPGDALVRTLHTGIDAMDKLVGEGNEEWVD